MFTSSERLLLAVSGGRDSVALLHLCQQAGFSFGLAHCNFQLRGAESDGDEAFVRELAAQYQVPLYVQRFDTEQYASQNGLSTQLAARALRYEWFEQLCAQRQYDWILTAHHQNDVAETVLLNLTRGNNWTSLRGILPKNGHVVRPLLFATQTQVAAYVAEQGLNWREDSSNQTDHYARNLLRHHAVPVLTQVNPRAVQAVAQTAQRLAAVERVWTEIILQTQQHTMTQQGESWQLDYQKLANFSEPLERLAGLLQPFGFDYEEAIQIWAARKAQAGKIFYSASHTLLKDREIFLITRPPARPNNAPVFLYQNQQTWPLPHATLHCTVVAEVAFGNDPNVLYVDADLLGFPLLARTWQQGDWFCPLGMNGQRKKVSDLLIDRKVPLTDKPKVWVLESNGKIVWIIGLRADERFKVTTTTKNILKIIYNLSI